MEVTMARRDQSHQRQPTGAGVEPSKGELEEFSLPTIGAHLVVQRRGYTHHGIYVGRGKVVHYCGLSRSLRGGPVREATLAEFADGQAYWVETSDFVAF